MATKSLGSLTVDVIAKVGGFARGMTQAERQAERSSKEIERTMRGLSKGIDAALKVAAVGIVGGATALTVAFKNAVDGADELSKTAQKIGITTESLSTLGYAAGLADVELSELQAGLSRLTKFQSEAAQGTEKNVELFARLGIAYRETNGALRDTGEVFREVADRLSKMPDGADKAAIALDIFGRSGANLVPLLNEGAVGIAELEERARRLGLELSQNAGKDAEELNDRLSDLNSVVDGLALTVATELLPDIIDLTGALTDSIREGGGMVEVGRDIADIFRGLGKVFKAADLAIGGMGERFNIAAQYKNAFLDPAGWQQYQAEIDKSNARLAGLAEQSEALALLARQDFGIDPKIMPIEDGSMPRGARPRVRGTPMQDGETQVINAGPGFGEGGGSSRPEVDRSAVQAAREADREAEEAARQLAEQIREAEAAQLDFLTTTENLRAELGGPLAQVQLDYIRREDDLVELAKLAGLSNDELAESLGLLEAARLRDVDAINKQAEAEAQRAREIADQPLIDQMDSLRDTTAGFFVDLAKNGEDAIDRLQDYLLDSALESIGKQIAEGLFGDFGTTGSGSAGSGFASFLGSLFGGGRAMGGPVSGNRIYEVGEENRPELLKANGRQYLIPGNDGRVLPMGAAIASQASEAARQNRGGVVQHITFNLPGRYDMRTQAQIAADMNRVGQRSAARGTA